MAIPYVGITGPKTVQEVNDTIEAFYQGGFSMETHHVPMVGILVSYNTLNGKPGNNRYPAIGRLPELMAEMNGRVLSMLHFNTKKQDTLAGQINEVFRDIYHNCKALQLNVVWPKPDQVKKIKDQYPEMQIVFQASHRALEDHTMEQAVERISEYGDSIDYILIDPSGGRGLEFDMDDSLELFEALKQLPATIGVAGGFTGINVEQRTRQVMDQAGLDNFCIDAEGGLRDKLSDAYGDDDLNPDKVKLYINKAAASFQLNV